MERRPRALGADEIETRRATRRTALAAVGGALGAITLGVTARAEARGPASKATDSDPTDGEGHGRTGVTDRDAGEGSDGAGRGVCPSRGWSDSDPSDRRGQGRGPCR